MGAMPIIFSTTPEGSKELDGVKRRLSLGSMLPPELPTGASDNPAAEVARILSDVRRRGDAAVLEYTRKFDRVSLAADQLRVPRRQIDEALFQADRSFLRALDIAIENVRRYQKAMLPPAPPAIAPAGASPGSGARLAVRYEPLHRVGAYIPGGAGAYPSSVVMTVVPAQVAGVKSICLCSPMRNGRVSPAVLAAAGRLGVYEVYALGGAQAIAALAFGTATVASVEKIVGPGNSYVQLAKKELFGLVDIDGFAGPSEVIVLADDSADAEMVAAELLAQAEHAPGSCLLITADAALARAVQGRVDQQLQTLSRRDLIIQSLPRASALIVVPGHDDALNLVNDFAPEHLRICTRHSTADADKIKNAGAIFIGPFTPVAAGDYLAGPSHVLPTSGTARVFSGLAAESFRRRISIVEFDAAALNHAAPAIATLARTEGFDAHARSVEVRRSHGYSAGKGVDEPAGTR